MTSKEWDLKESKEILGKCAKTYPAIKSILVQNKETSRNGNTYIFTDNGWFSTQLVLMGKNKNGNVFFDIVESEDKNTFSLRYKYSDLSSADVISILDTFNSICFDGVGTEVSIPAEVSASQTASCQSASSSSMTSVVLSSSTTN